MSGNDIHLQRSPSDDPLHPSREILSSVLDSDTQEDLSVTHESVEKKVFIIDREKKSFGFSFRP